MLSGGHPRVTALWYILLGLTVWGSGGRIGEQGDPRTQPSAQHKAYQPQEKIHKANWHVVSAAFPVTGSLWEEAHDFWAKTRSETGDELDSSFFPRI